ncbi:C4-dicarboxylate transporter DcuC [Photobacterium swingsii]|uniref:C4-dicarboxylate transporter DcuC n=1 Tax=Photobacterium swingsii TaxID=680026 RepID=UPI00354F75E0
MIQILVVLLIIIAAARLILTGYKTEAILFMAGIILMACTGLFGWGDVLPAKVASTNLAAFDPFKFVSYMLGYRAGGLGLTIMVLMGFAELMTRIKADAVIVRLAVKPLSVVKNKNILLFFGYIIGASLQLAIPSATALAVLLMVTLYPILTGLGISRASASGVIASTLGLTLTPLGVDAIKASESVGMGLMDYLSYQAPTSAVAIVAVGIAHVMWQSYQDKKDGHVIDADLEAATASDPDPAPNIYAILPMLPIIAAIVFSKLVISTIHLDVVTIVLISVFISLVFEGIKTRSLKESLDCFGAFMKGCGNALTGVVFLLVAAGVFAYGIQSTGAINHLIESAQGAGMPALMLTLVFAVVVGLAALVMGSGNAAFLSFVDIVPTVAHSMGANPVAMMLPMQQASALARAASPVAACVIVSAGGAKLSTFEVVKRTSVPMLVGFVVHFIAVMILVN